MTQLSIVTTLYKSQPYVAEFYARCCAVLQKLNIADYEFIFVDDGSPDQSLAAATSLNQKDSKVKVLELSRNFGHHKAIMTGLEEAKGNHIFLIDVDLEEKPELLEEMWQKMAQNPSIDLIYGQQIRRKGFWFERVSGAIFYKMINFLSNIKMPSNVLIARLMTKKYKESLILHKDKNVFFLGISTITGFNQIAIPADKGHKKSTTYTFRKKISQTIKSITSFSSFPLLFVSYIGGIVFGASFCYMSFIILNRLFFAKPIDGWASIMVSIYMMSGFIVLCLGIIGIYIAKIFEEVKNRPYTIIKNKIG